MVRGEVGAAFLEHLLEPLEPHGGELLLLLRRPDPPHVRLVLLGELHGRPTGSRLIPSARDEITKKAEMAQDCWMFLGGLLEERVPNLGQVAREE